MHVPLDQRPCAACGSADYVSSAVWNFAQGPRCLCCHCYNDHWRFTESGHLEQRRPRKQPLSDLDAAIARENEDYHARLREASQRRWARQRAEKVARIGVIE